MIKEELLCRVSHYCRRWLSRKWISWDIMRGIGEGEGGDGGDQQDGRGLEGGDGEGAC